MYGLHPSAGAGGANSLSTADSAIESLAAAPASEGSGNWPPPSSVRGAQPAGAGLAEDGARNSGGSAEDLQSGSAAQHGGSREPAVRARRTAGAAASTDLYGSPGASGSPSGWEQDTPRRPSPRSGGPLGTLWGLLLRPFSGWQSAGGEGGYLTLDWVDTGSRGGAFLRSLLVRLFLCCSWDFLHSFDL